MTPRRPDPLEQLKQLPYGHGSDIITSVTFDAITGAIPEALTVSEWAETYRFLSPERSHRHGKYSVELTPYLREPMDCASDPEVRRLTFIKSVQIAGTTLAENIVGYYMHGDPSPVLYVCETEDKASAWSKESLAPMIRDTPVLARLVKDVRTRDSGNTIKSKKFPGGHLAIGWATSPATLSSRPRRVVILDEEDAYESSKEGDPADLAIARTRTYKESKKIIDITTPRNRLENPPGTSIEAPRYTRTEFIYQQSDRRKLWVPCTHCGEFQILEWENLNHETACFICQLHGCKIEEEYKAEMLAAHEWRPEADFRGHAGFFIWEAYSPFATWAEIIEDYQAAKRSGDQDKLKTFFNLSLARGWQESVEKVETSALVQRREKYYSMVPRGVLVLTCGVDVQGNRLELEIVGWGLENESWSIDYVVIEGDPAQAEVWNQLKLQLLRTFPYEDGGDLRVWVTCIDSGGHHPDEVRKFCRANAGRRVFAIKGSSTPGKPLITRPSLWGRPPVKLFSIGTEGAKDSLSNRLKVAKPGPGYCHFPIDETRYTEEHFKQILSERPVTVKRGHKQVHIWEKISISARNEALDCRVYAMSALAILNPNLALLASRFQEAWKKRQAAAIPEPQLEEQPPPPDEPDPKDDPDDELETQKPKPGTRRRGRGNFATRWRHGG
jgi:phage terminase large subunit GpA-like protein